MNTIATNPLKTIKTRQGMSYTIDETPAPAFRPMPSFGGNQLERITRTPNAANHLPGVRAMNHKSKKTLLSA